MKKLPLMPKATAIWLVENTSLTFEQIAEFCGLHMLEVQSIADGEFDLKMSGLDPITSAQLTADEIKRCEQDPTARLMLAYNPYFEMEKNKTSRKSTQRSKRQDKPDAIAWIVKYYPQMPDSDIIKLIGTTRATIKSIKNKTHKSYPEIEPKSPVLLGLSTQVELDFFTSKLTRE